MTNRLAVSLAPPDTDICLSLLGELAPRIGMAEVRLDLMDSFDLPRLIAAAACPLIITCRPPREGGRFAGSEAERLDILAQAMDLGCAYVDVEWDCLAALFARRRTQTQLVASRHWTDDMPAALWPAYDELRRQADVVKLVGMARRAGDVVPIFELLNRAASPVIGIAMGEAGRITRLLAPCFGSCLLTYGAHAPAAVTAPGQLSVSEMVERYHLQAAGPHTQIHLHLCASAASTGAVIEKNADVAPGAALYVPFVVAQEQVAGVVPGLRAHLPHLTITADPELAGLLRDLAA